MGKFQFGEYEARKALKAFGWSVASAFVALLISLAANLELPAEYAFMIPVINVVLYSLKEFVTDNAA